MDRKSLLSEMKDSIGTQEPIVFFAKMIDVLNLLFDRIDLLEEKVTRAAIAASNWDPRVASDMLAVQVHKLRKADKDVYVNEIDAFRAAYVEDKVTQNYKDFVKFWEDTLGFHPFLDSK